MPRPHDTRTLADKLRDVIADPAATAGERDNAQRALARMPQPAAPTYAERMGALARESGFSTATPAWASTSHTHNPFRPVEFMRDSSKPRVVGVRCANGQTYDVDAMVFIDAGVMLLSEQFGAACDAFLDWLEAQTGPPVPMRFVRIIQADRPYIQVRCKDGSRWRMPMRYCIVDGVTFPPSTAQFERWWADGKPVV